jgi:hypothetical protein
VATSLELQTDDADSIVERAMDYVVYAAMEALAEGDEYYDALEFAGQTAIDQALELLDEDHIETEAGKSIVSYGDPRPGRGRSRPFGGARRYTSPDYIHRYDAFARNPYLSSEDVGGADEHYAPRDDGNTVSFRGNPYPARPDEDVVRTEREKLPASERKNAFNPRQRPREMLLDRIGRLGLREAMFPGNRTK